MSERWLTYQQLGELLGMSAEAARQRAMRFKWRKQKGNDGRTLVLFPETTIAQTRARTPVRPAVQTPVQTPNVSGLAEAVEAFQKLEAQVRAERDAARAEVEAERARTAQAEREREEARIRAAAAEGELRGLRDAMAREARQREQLEATLKAAEAQRDAAQAVRDALQLEQAQARRQPKQDDLFGGYIGRVVQAITGRKPRG